MKLETVLNLKKEIFKLLDVLEILEEDYLKQLDDDLWTVNLEVEPQWCGEYNCDVTFITDKQLTKKYIIRFCEDYGLSLKSYADHKDSFEYVFELEKDIMESLKNMNI